MKIILKNHKIVFVKPKPKKEILLLDDKTLIQLILMFFFGTMFYQFIKLYLRLFLKAVTLFNETTNEYLKAFYILGLTYITEKLVIFCLNKFNESLKCE